MFLNLPALSTSKVSLDGRDHEVLIKIDSERGVGIPTFLTPGICGKRKDQVKWSAICTKVVNSSIPLPSCSGRKQLLEMSSVNLGYSQIKLPVYVT